MLARILIVIISLIGVIVVPYNYMRLLSSLFPSFGEVLEDEAQITKWLMGLLISILTLLLIVLGVRLSYWVVAG